MAHNRDWIPHGQDQFVDWSQQFAAALTAHSGELNLAAALVTEVTGKQSAFITGWESLQAQGKSEAKTAAKEALIEGHKTYLRDFFNQNLRYNHNLTTELRRDLGVPIPDTTHSPIVVGDHLVGFELEAKGTYQVSLRCWDEETKEKKILYGMSGIVVFYAVSDAPITDDALLTQSLLITKTTHTLTGNAGQRGKWLSVACCWQSETGERGTPSAVQSAIIP
jgi:hypothetical protein